ncbi:MAG: RhuM family protein [Alphaproteobacteria bacterium]
MQNSSQIIFYKNDSNGIEVDVILKDENVWLTQTQMGTLFGKARTTINEHIKNIFSSKELSEEKTMRQFNLSDISKTDENLKKTDFIEAKSKINKNTEFPSFTRAEAKVGNPDFPIKSTNYYNLDLILSVGYRVKSSQGIQFRQWATKKLKEYIIKGFVLNDNRFKTGKSMNYFNELQNRIREIRLSERFFYQKIKDIYTTSIDYDKTSEKTIEFFKIVQNKLLWAVSQKTAAELVYRRVDASLPLLGMKSFNEKNLTKKDISVAKNYLDEKEIKLLGLIVEQYLAFAETMAEQKKPLYMKDWIGRLDIILQMNGRELLTNAGKISQKLATEKSALEFNKYKINQKNIKNEENLKELEKDIKKLKK